jgi:hypothetical protein
VDVESAGTPATVSLLYGRYANETAKTLRLCLKWVIDGVSMNIAGALVRSP